MKGTVTKRGKQSWRLKFDIERDPVTAARRFHTCTVRGTKKEAEAELARLMTEANKGAHVDNSKLTVGEWLERWLDGKHDISPVTRERYHECIAISVAPTLGKVELQKLRPIHVKEWLSKLVTNGSRTNGPLSGRTVRVPYLVLHGALAEAVRLDLVARNVADVVAPPKIEATEIEILTQEEIAAVLASLSGSWLYPIASLALATGMRRGELLALRWQDVDFDKASVKGRAVA
jgi:integrase